MTASDGDRPPSVEQLAQRIAHTGLPHPILVDVARRAVAGGPEAVDARACELAEAERRALLQPVVNATGVLLHTNLGRAPLAVDRPAGYTNLELDLASGRRGDRSAHAARLLALACGAGDALVVNNGASALHLALAALAGDGSEAVVSRGELVEIGGGFRIPDVMAASRARLVEVGTTNRTVAADYEAALGPATRVLLKVHASNYRMTGFVSSVAVGDLARLAGPCGAAVVADLGSGLLDAGCPWLDGGAPPWLRSEPAVRQTLGAGAGLVTFSCDKLVGGPQGGVIAGDPALVGLCRRHPLARVVRAGGLVLEALQEVALAYLRRDAGAVVPLWRMAAAPVEDLRARAAALGVGTVVECESVMGGGTLPGIAIASAGVRLPGDVTAVLRSCSPPVIARVVAGTTVCDLRTVFAEQDASLGAALKEAAAR